jgi:hypothetical protein
MVGGIQDANKTADEAIRNAYYNAEQSKAQATANYNERLSEAEKAYTDKLVSVLGAVGSGEIDAKTAETIAKAYGLSEADIAKITSASDDYDAKAKENEIADLDNAVNVVKSTPTTKTVDVADNLIQNGKTNEGQGIYFENDLALISNIGEDLTIEEVKETLEMHKRTGRISENDYSNLVKYLDKKTESGVVDADKVRNRYIDDWWKFSFITAWADKNATVTIGDEKYRVNIDDTVKLSDDEMNKLNSLAGESDIVKMGNDYYIKMRNKENKWFKVKDNRTVDAFFDKVSHEIASESLVVSPTYGQTDYNP